MTLTGLEREYMTELTLRRLNRASALKERLAQLEARELLREETALERERRVRELHMGAAREPLLPRRARLNSIAIVVAHFKPAAALRARCRSSNGTRCQPLLNASFCIAAPSLPLPSHPGCRRACSLRWQRAVTWTGPPSGTPPTLCVTSSSTSRPSRCAARDWSCSCSCSTAAAFHHCMHASRQHITLHA